jgi:hypothetical protein
MAIPDNDTRIYHGNNWENANIWKYHFSAKIPKIYNIGSNWQNRKLLDNRMKS